MLCFVNIIIFIVVTWTSVGQHTASQAKNYALDSLPTEFTFLLPCIAMQFDISFCIQSINPYQSIIVIPKPFTRLGSWCLSILWVHEKTNKNTCLLQSVGKHQSSVQGMFIGAWENHIGSYSCKTLTTRFIYCYLVHWLEVASGAWPIIADQLQWERHVILAA